MFPRAASRLPGDIDEVGAGSISLMDEAAVTEYITRTFPEVETTTNFGYTFFFYRTDRTLPFATFISADDEYDRISQVDSLSRIKIQSVHSLLFRLLTA